MSSKVRTAVAVVFVVLSFGSMAAGATAAPSAARSDCVRHCHF
jgi:hypothetical protein